VIATEELAEKILSEIGTSQSYYYRISESNRNNRNNYCRSGNYLCDLDPPDADPVIDAFIL